jgi:ketosteroid isomerase-like protein
MHPNEELLRKGYAAFDSYDLDTIQALFADDIVWTVPGRNQLAGVYKGKDQVFEFFAKLLTVTEGTFKIELHDVLANDDHTIAITTTRAQAAGKSFEGRGAAIYHVAEGKVAEAWFLPLDAYAEDEFFG